MGFESVTFFNVFTPQRLHGSLTRWGRFCKQHRTGLFPTIGLVPTIWQRREVVRVM